MLRRESSSLSWGTKYGEEASMVMQWTVNPPPSGTTGSIPVFSTRLSRIREEVSQESHKLQSLVRVQHPQPNMIKTSLHTLNISNSDDYESI